MMDKAQYYHGAAVVSLLEQEDFFVKKLGLLGYVINESVFVFLKYTTKAKTPWRFSFDQEDVDRCLKMASQYQGLIVGLVCGGDGVCGLKWDEARILLGDKLGWVSVQRRHNESYGVDGSCAELEKKIPVGRWSNLPSEMIRSY